VADRNDAARLVRRLGTLPDERYAEALQEIEQVIERLESEIARRPDSDGLALDTQHVDPSLIRATSSRGLDDDQHGPAVDNANRQKLEHLICEWAISRSAGFSRADVISFIKNELYDNGNDVNWEQWKHWVNYSLTKLRKTGTIVNIGTRTDPRWIGSGYLFYNAQKEVINVLHDLNLVECKTKASLGIQPGEFIKVPDPFSESRFRIVARLWRDEILAIEIDDNVWRIDSKNRNQSDDRVRRNLETLASCADLFRKSHDKLSLAVVYAGLPAGTRLPQVTGVITATPQNLDSVISRINESRTLVDVRPKISMLDLMSLTLSALWENDGRISIKELESALIRNHPSVIMSPEIRKRLSNARSVLNRMGVIRSTERGCWEMNQSGWSFNLNDLERAYTEYNSRSWRLRRESSSTGML